MVDLLDTWPLRVWRGANSFYTSRVSNAADSLLEKPVTAPKAGALMPEVILLAGLPGSGKSSFYRARFAASHLHLSKDNWPNASRREARLQRELRAALQAGNNVVVDNTNATQEQRATVVAIAREAGAHIAVYVLESSLAECLARNAARLGRARVPDVALYICAANWQMPSRDEGFDALFCVRLRDGDFEVKDGNLKVNK